MATPLSRSSKSSRSSLSSRAPETAISQAKLGFNVDFAAIAIALALAALIRLNVIHGIGW